jgi:predicted RNA binding protein YcfA (HicA-like mRNA interferase family)
VLTFLRRAGFKLVGVPEVIWRNGLTGTQVIVPYHRGRILPLGTMRAIIEGSGIQIDKWFE